MTETNDTIPCEPPTVDAHEAPTGKLRTGIDALADYVAAVDNLTGQVSGINVTLATVRSQIETLATVVQSLQAAIESPSRPSWVDDVLVAVTSITPTRALEQRVTLHGEQIAEIQSRCDGQHGSDPVVFVPPNGSASR